MKLIVNADDFGYTPAVSYGILDAFKNGIVTSTTMMCNSPYMEHAVELAKQNPGLGVGVHLVLTSRTPLCDDVPSLLDENGKFYHQSQIFEHAKEEDIEREWTAQIERFLASGLNPTHLDSHHNVHSHPIAFPVAIKLASKYGLPIRNALNDNFDYGSVRTTDIMLRKFYGDHVTYETLEEQLKRVAAKPQTAEINCHPGYIDEELRSQSSYVDKRTVEYTLLTSERIKNFAKELNIEFTTYAAI
ncbi:MAG TPA: chitin disaccharide deacetylase [Bacillus sp. (in: firmicutes)]|uniref:chitin disaccharide deacetylase n=1 Tax=Bacillus litorisediminis TaxID=2922713 RepID=UPI001FAC9645|nr:chitin disaccharide deacetylase [Bacillus litorisediminis]HWO78225.1 chitin disaccharide deacetylase [Bacillus sp. (in: firmicutes)]